VLTGSASVLAVDDNPTIRKAISMRLSSKGFDVVTAPGGEEALALVEKRKFDLVLLDLQMPGMCGDEVLKRLRDRYDEVQLPIIMLAASDDKKDINRTLDLGANDYMTKPGDLPVLLARIKTQLSLKQTAQRLHDQTCNESKRTGEGGRTGSTIDLHEELLREEDKTEDLRYHVLYDNTPMTCFTLDRDGTIMFANRFGVQYLGYQREDLFNKSILDLYPSADRGIAQEYLASVVDLPGRIHRWDIRRLKKNGTSIWMRETARSIGTGTEKMILMTCEDIDDTYKLTEKLSYQSSHDELTGLGNRKALEERLAQVIDSAHTEKTEHMLAIIDLDQFKIINETSGHTAGDELLRQIAKLLKGIVRKRDTLARVGGDEFALLLEDRSLSDTRTDIEAIQRAIEGYRFVCDGKSHRLSASVGIVPINAQCPNTASALGMADTARFAAQDSGRNRIHVYQPDDESVTAMHGEMRWAARINEALLDDRFELNFQPITPIGKSSDVGDHYELLIRMRDEFGNIVMPREFLPAAERYNLSDKLDRWVIGHALNWLRSNPVLLERLYLCDINLSGQSMGNEGILHFILDQIDEGGIPPEKLCFEVTETAAIADLAQASRFISLLKERGCKFALDDFGSGFSSLAYLKSLPVDFLKIDGSFVRDMVSDSIDLAMVKAINEIAHIMGKKTIAEFVEDRSILEALKVLGVDYAQGFGIARPAPIAELSKSILLPTG
jgi:diguanylate cyclase (GGDEF)-like protein/PAS domain S-box-containing protein